MRPIKERSIAKEAIALCLLLGFGIGLILIAFLQSAIAPSAKMRAQEQVNTLVTRILQEQLTQLAADAIKDAISFEKDHDGRITAVKTDTAALGALQHEMISLVYESIETVDLSGVSVPVSRTRLTIPVDGVRLVQAQAVFQNQLSDAGINQTRHATVLQITAQVQIIMPTFSTETTINTEIIVYETLIIGAVPQQYYVETGESLWT